jgi:hypothetical protein
MISVALSVKQRFVGVASMAAMGHSTKSLRDSPLKREA